MREEFFQKRRVFADYPVYRQQPAREEFLRLFVAVRYDSSGCFLLIHKCCAPGDQKPVGVVHALVGLQQPAVDLLQRLRGGCCRKRSVMHRAVPAAAEKEEVCFIVLLSGKDLSQGFRYGKRVIEYPERVYVASECVIFEQFADVLGKAGTQEQQLLGMGDGGQAYGEFNRGCKIHYQFVMEDKQTSLGVLPVREAR